MEYYDIRAEEARTRSFERKLEIAEINHLAVQKALSQHPVVEYVLHLPVEDPSYPAMGTLDLNRGYAGDSGRSQEGDGQERPWEYHQYISWQMPGHDLNRPRDKGCGFIRNVRGGLVYVACPSDREHHCKGKRKHCWSRKCPECMNDTCIKQGISMERQLLAFKVLSEKSGIRVGDIGHWVVSPPQELAKRMVQTKPEFDDLCGYIDDSMTAFGALAGVTVPHLWRQKEDIWAFSPHFHILCYGRIDTTGFRKANPGWVIKKVHPREKIRSIRHTAAYLLTHASIGIAEVDPDDIDWEQRFFDLAWPDSPTEEDYEALLRGKGRLAGDYSGVDWLEWTKRPLCTELKIRYWGGASRKAIRTVGYYRQYKIRVCEECGALLRVYDGPDDRQGQMVRYIQDNAIVVSGGGIQLWQNAFQKYKDRLREADMNLADFARHLPFAASTLEFGLPQNNDIVCDGRFDDEASVLRRQRKAYGEKPAGETAEA